MNGIDIAGHQKGINLAVVPCDFVVIKATQGKSFVNPEVPNQITQALSQKKYIGVYHYANGVGVEAEINHFVNTVKPYLGKVILAIDWENNKDKYGNNDNPKFVAGDYKYCESLLKAVLDKTGITPFIYMSKSVARQYKWEVGRLFPFWCAQYRKTGVPTTYVDNPWTDDKGWGSFPGCKIFQYSSKGKLPGYNGNLDLDISYMDGAEWNLYAQGSASTENEPAQTNTGTKVYPTLRKGDRSEYVRAWQTFLNLNGYSCGTADGIFGAKTLKAVKAWQRAHPECGKVDGIIGPKTWASLPFVK